MLFQIVPCAKCKTEPALTLVLARTERGDWKEIALCVGCCWGKWTLPALAAYAAGEPAQRGWN